MEIVRTGQWLPDGANAAQRKLHGAKVTVLLEHMPKGSGPRLHTHPYGETWAVADGRIAFSDGEQSREAGPGDVVYVAPDEPHKFTVLSDHRIKMICIHQSEEFTTQWLE